MRNVYLLVVLMHTRRTMEPLDKGHLSIADSVCCPKHIEHVIVVRCDKTCEGKVLSCVCVCACLVHACVSPFFLYVSPSATSGSDCLLAEGPEHNEWRPHGSCTLSSCPHCNGDHWCATRYMM